MNKTFIIAEAGVNHNGSLDVAIQLIDAAVQAKADCVKFQTFRAERVASRFAPKAEYQTRTTDSSESQIEMIKKLELNEEQHVILMKHCQTCGIEFMSTPFDVESVDFLANVLNVSRIKIPSGEITNPLILLRAAKKGKPIILSTGMSTLEEVQAALGVLAFGFINSGEKPSPQSFTEAFKTREGQRALNEMVTLLHCTTEYPAPLEEVNLRAMDALREEFSLPVGYSDHTEGIIVPVAAVARGACVIEKHFTLDRCLPGPDHKASLEPDELASMVKAIRQTELTLGTGVKIPSPSEIKNMAIARKSLVAVRDIKKGEVFTEENMGVKRPGTGIDPFRYWDLLGEAARKDYGKDDLIDYEY